MILCSISLQLTKPEVNIISACFGQRQGTPLTDSMSREQVSWKVINIYHLQNIYSIAAEQHWKGYTKANWFCFLFNIRFAHLTRMNTSELDNRNIKKVFYSWLCYSGSNSKILQEGEWSLSMHINNSLRGCNNKATARWPSFKLRNSLTIFNLKLKWERKILLLEFYSLILLWKPW